MLKVKEAVEGIKQAAAKDLKELFKKVLTTHFTVFVEELENNKAKVYIHASVKFQYTNNHTCYATAQRSYEEEIANGLDLKEACQTARKIKEEFIRVSGKNAGMRFIKYEDFYMV